MFAPSPRLALFAALLAASAPCGSVHADEEGGVARFGELETALRAEDRAALAERSPDSWPRYELNIRFSEDLRSAEVMEQIAYTNTGAAPEESVWLRVFANEGTAEPRVHARVDACRPVRCDTISDGHSLWALRLERPLSPGATLTIQVSLQMALETLDASRTSTLGQLSDSMAALSGAGSGDYGLLAFGDGIASLAQFYAEVARKRNGQWVGADDSGIGDKGTDALRHVRARVSVPAGVSIVATGEERRLSDTRYEVLAPAVRDFTLLASREFMRIERQVGEVTVRSLGLARHRESVQQVLDTAVHALSTFEARFGPYPYRELDIVEAPVIGGAGGVEFSGLATVASHLYGDQDPLGALTGLLGGGMMPSRGSVREMVAAHEVAHQYWHGLVGSDSRREPVLDESLAQYSALLYFEARYGPARAQREADSQVAMNYRALRMLGRPDGAADRATNQFSTALEYAALVYGKAPFAFRTLARKLGARAVQQALRTYVRGHRFSEARRADLGAAFPAGRQRQTAEQVFARFFDQTHGDDDLGKGKLPALAGGAGGTVDLSSLLQGMLGGGGGAGLGELLGGALGGQGAGSTSLGGGEGADPELVMKTLQSLFQNEN